MIIGDLHLGIGCYDRNIDVEIYDKMVVDFMKWTVKVAHRQKATHVVQMGDWFDNSQNIDIRTINYGIQCAGILSNYFGKDNTFAILGNHDIYISDRGTSREINSLKLLKNEWTMDSYRLLINFNKHLLTCSLKCVIIAIDCIFCSSEIKLCNLYKYNR